MSILNCDLWSLQKRHSWKQQSLGYLSHKEKKWFTGAPENTFSRKEDTNLKLPQQKIFLKVCLCWTVIFDLSDTFITENNRIWIIWAINKKHFTGAAENIFFYVGRHILKSSIAENIFEKVLLLNCNLLAIQNRHSRKQQDLSYLNPKEKNISLVPLRIPLKMLEVGTYLKFP